MSSFALQLTHRELPSSPADAWSFLASFSFLFWLYNSNLTIPVASGSGQQQTKEKWLGARPL